MEKVFYSWKKVPHKFCIQEEILHRVFWDVLENQSAENLSGVCTFVQRCEKESCD